MSRLLRHLLIWLSCTAASVTAVILTIHFVVGSTRPTAPVARSAPEEPRAVPSPAPPPSPSATPSPRPDRSAPSTVRPRPVPSRAAVTPRGAGPSPTPTPSPSPRRSRSAGQGDPACGGDGSGVYTVPSEGGKATMRFGGDGVCLVSAVPQQGFTVSTEQSAPQTLTVTFSASRHRSEITATSEPSGRVTVHEVSF